MSMAVSPRDVERLLTPYGITDGAGRWKSQAVRSRWPAVREPLWSGSSSAGFVSSHFRPPAPAAAYRCFGTKEANEAARPSPKPSTAAPGRLHHAGRGGRGTAPSARQSLAEPGCEGL